MSEPTIEQVVNLNWIARQHRASRHSSVVVSARDDAASALRAVLREMDASGESTKSGPIPIAGFVIDMAEIRERIRKAVGDE